VAEHEPVAQLVAALIANPRLRGSIPSRDKKQSKAVSSVILRREHFLVDMSLYKSSYFILCLFHSGGSELLGTYIPPFPWMV
jgi:hypothetical protein